MIARVTRRQRTDRQGRVIDRVRAYLSRSDPGRDEASARRQVEYRPWESVADVADYVHELEEVVSGNSVSAHHLEECRRRYVDAVVDLRLRRHLHVKTYADAASSYAFVLELLVVRGEEPSVRQRKRLQHDYEDAYAMICRDGV